MMRVSSLFLMIIPFACYLALFSWIARIRGHQLPTYWASTGAALAPWFVSILILMGAVLLLPAKLQQAGGMALMFPGLAAVFIALVAPIVTLFMPVSTPLMERIKWMAGMSSVPALIVLGFLLWVFIQDARKAI